MKEGHLRNFPASDPLGGGSERNRRRWRLPAISGIHLLILATGLLAFIANLALLRGGEAPRRQVAVSRIELAPGRRLQLDDIQLIPVDVDEPIASGLLSDSELPRYQDWVITRPISADSLISKTDLRDPLTESTSRAMSFPIAAEHAVGGDLVPGDLVDVIRVDEEQARFVATGLEVLGVPTPAQGGLVPSGGFHLVLGVNERTALTLALALAHGQVEVVRATGAAPVTVTSLQESPPDSEVFGSSMGQPDDPFGLLSRDPPTYPDSPNEGLP